MSPHLHPVPTDNGGPLTGACARPGGPDTAFGVGHGTIPNAETTAKQEAGPPATHEYGPAVNAGPAPTAEAKVAPRAAHRYGPTPEIHTGAEAETDTDPRTAIEYGLVPSASTATAMEASTPRAASDGGSGSRFGNRRIPLPENDDFYCPPEDFTRHAPGAILRARRIELALFGALPQRVSAWHLLYRTCDLNGVPEVAVTTVLLPAGTGRPGRPLLSFQCAIDGVSSRCSPSYALRRGARALGAIPQLELPVIAEALARGWAVSVPDHGGLGGHFGVAREPGYRALDAIRAALAFAPLGLDPATEVGLWGYSGGGLATAWAAELAADYAPEVRIVGAVAGSPVGDPGATFLRLNGSAMSGFSTVCVAALRRAYPDLDRMLHRHATAEFHAMLADAATRTTLSLLPRLARANLDRYTESSFAELLDRPRLRRVLDDIRPGHRAPAMPMLVVQGVNDELIAVEDIDRHVDRYREAGAHVRYLRDRLSLHLPLLYLATPATMNWLAARFDHRPLPPAATETVWSLAASCRAVDHLRFAAVFARMLLGRPLTARAVRPARPRIRRSAARTPDPRRCG